MQVRTLEQGLVQRRSFATTRRVQLFGSTRGYGPCWIDPGCRAGSRRRPRRGEWNDKLEARSVWGCVLVGEVAAVGVCVGASDRKAEACTRLRCVVAAGEAVEQPWLEFPWHT
jgi:hypothetical protein